MFDSISKGKYWGKSLTLVSGCTRCSPGCDHCWALAMEKRFDRQPKKTIFDKEAERFIGQRFFGNIRIHPERLSIPLKRKKPTVWALWNDMAHEQVNEGFFWEVMEVINVCPEHIFLLLTKRPQNLKRQFDHLGGLPFNQKAVDDFECYWRERLPLKNLWLGITVCNQAEADEKIPILLQIPAAVRWVSYEPALSGVDFTPWLRCGGCGYSKADMVLHGDHRLCKNQTPILDWICMGGETGPGARPMKLEWVRDIRDQCQAANVPFFFKAWGPRKEVGRILDGRTWDELPNLAVREVPCGH